MLSRVVGFGPGCDGGRVWSIGRGRDLEGPRVGVMRRVIGRLAMLIVCCLVCVAGGGDTAAAREDTPRVMVLPFDGTSAGDFRYLTDSIRTMVASRLAAKPGVEVVEYTLSPTTLAALQEGAEKTERTGAVFAKLQVDYLVSGTLYALQTGLKIQVNLSRRGDDRRSADRVFTVLAENEGRIIPSVEELTADISGRGLDAGTAGPLLPEDLSKEGGALTGFSTEHPEKAFKRGLYSGAVVAEGNMKITSLGVRRSSNLPLTLVSMATGDLDGDGKLEIVAASGTALEIYRFEKSVFKKLSSHAFGTTYKVHAVNLADLDHDGRQEIYVSANDYIPPASAIFTWSKEGGLKTRLAGIKYYIRPVWIPGEGLILAGQAGSDDFEDGFVGENVVKLQYSKDGRGVAADKVIPLPPKIRLFDFVYAQLDGRGGKELVAIDRHEKLLVYDADQSLLWVSEDDHGGSRNFIGIPKGAPIRSTTQIGGDANSEEVLKRPYIYVPLRLVAVDLDHDGKDEIIVGGNNRVTPKIMVNFRMYDGGTVVCLGWRDSAMADLWRTNTVTGYLADFTFLPSTGGEANHELYVAQVPDSTFLGLSFASDSKLLKYQMSINSRENVQ